MKSRFVAASGAFFALVRAGLCSPRVNASRIWSADAHRRLDQLWGYVGHLITWDP